MPRTYENSMWQCSLRALLLTVFFGSIVCEFWAKAWRPSQSDMVRESIRIAIRSSHGLAVFRIGKGQDGGTERGIDFFLVDDRVLIQEFAADENWPRKWQFQKSENSVHPCLTEKFYVVVLMPSGRRRSLQLVRNHFLCVDEYTSDGTWDGLYGQLTRMYGRARQAGSVVPVETPVELDRIVHEWNLFPRHNRRTCEECRRLESVSIPAEK